MPSLLIGPRVEAWFERPTESYSGDDARAVHEAIDAAGSVAFAEAYAASLLVHAERWFEVAFAGCAPSPALSFLREVIPFMAARAHRDGNDRRGAGSVHDRPARP